LRKDCREIYPSRQILELARDTGVPITFGSDAHAPAEVGLNFGEAVELARRVGYTHRCTFIQRQRTDVTL
jgi:histidinol-phosphatase (PHP family)